jgi:hypothetical protein
MIRLLLNRRLYLTLFAVIASAPSFGLDCWWSRRRTRHRHPCGHVVEGGPIQGASCKSRESVHYCPHRPGAGRFLPFGMVVERKQFPYANRRVLMDCHVLRRLPGFRSSLAGLMAKWLRISWLRSLSTVPPSFFWVPQGSLPATRRRSRSVVDEMGAFTQVFSRLDWQKRNGEEPRVGRFPQRQDDTQWMIAAGVYRKPL